MLVLAIIPVFFAFYAFTFEINPFFLLALVGLALTVYGVIVPTELRDYFGDKNMGIQTMTVRLGLSKSTLFGIVLLIIGPLFTAIALLLEWWVNQQLWLSGFLFAIPISVLFVLGKFRKLYWLSKNYEVSKTNRSDFRQKIVELSSDNPKWIMIVTQTYSMLSLILFASKFLLVN